MRSSSPKSSSSLSKKIIDLKFKPISKFTKEIAMLKSTSNKLYENSKKSVTNLDFKHYSDNVFNGILTTYGPRTKLNQSAESKNIMKEIGNIHSKSTDKDRKAVIDSILDYLNNPANEEKTLYKDIIHIIKDSKSI